VEWIVVGADEPAFESAAYGVEGEDLAAAELADENVVAMAAEVSGCECETPGGVQERSVLEAVEELSAGGEDVDESPAGSVDFVMTGSILLGVGDVDVAADVLDVEGSVSLGHALVLEAILAEAGGVEGGVERSS